MNTTVSFSTVRVICSGAVAGGEARVVSGVRFDLFRRNGGGACGVKGLSSDDPMEVAEVEVLMAVLEAADERDEELDDREILPPKLDLSGVTGGLGSVCALDSYRALRFASSCTPISTLCSFDLSKVKIVS